MSLILPGSPGWAYCSHNVTGTPSTTVPGTAVVANTTTAHADGAAVTLLTALTHDVEYLVIGVHGNSTAATITRALMDILYDPAGGTSWTALINDLMVGYAASQIATTAGSGSARWYHFPIWIPAGSTIGARTRSAVTSLSTRVFIFAFGGNRNPGSWWCGQTVTEIGITPGSSAGTTHTPGNSGTFSSWASLGSTTPAIAYAIQFGFSATINNLNNLTYHIEFGLGSGSQKIGPTIWMQTGSSETIITPMNWGPQFCTIPAGSQLQVRGTCSSTGQALEFSAYLVH
jgi:hypothetical protein